MINKIESLSEYIEGSIYKEIGVPILTLIRRYDTGYNWFTWEWKTILCKDDDDFLSWEDRFPWYDVPIWNYEFGLTESEMNSIIELRKDYYEVKPYKLAPDASDFEKIIFDSMDGNDSDTRFAAGNVMMELGRWKAKRILPYRSEPVDAFASEPNMQKKLLDNLSIKARDAAARMVVFTSQASDGNGAVQTFRFACKEFDYKKYILLEGCKKNG